MDDQFLDDDEDKVNEEDLTTKVDGEALRLERRAHKKKLQEARDRAQIITEVYGEQPFIPGVDPGLKVWIYVREQLRAVNSGDLKLNMTYPTRIKYNYRGYWMQESHAELPKLMAEIDAERELKKTEEIRRKEEKIRVVEAAQEAKRVLEAFLAQETPEEKEIRLAADAAEAAQIQKEAGYMHKAELESKNENKAYRLYLEEALEDSRSRAATAELRARSRGERYEGVRYNADGSIKEDRGVYGVLPLLDKEEPRRVSGLTLPQFINHITYSSDKAECLLLAFNHQHWNYFELLMGAAGPTGARMLINMPMDQNQKTLLHYAVMRGDPERVAYLLDHGADPLKADHQGNTPLHVSFDHEVWLHFHDVAIANDLLTSRLVNKARGALRSEKLVNKTNKRGTSVLHRSILLGALDFVKLFLKKKAKVFVFDSCGKLPIQYAKEEWEQDVKDLFNDNVRFCGKRMHMEMWAYMMSRKFVVSIFNIVAPTCVICKRKQYECSALKNKDFRYWLYSHDIAKSLTKKRS